MRLNTFQSDPLGSLTGVQPVSGLRGRGEKQRTDTPVDTHTDGQSDRQREYQDLRERQTSSGELRSRMSIAQLTPGQTPASEPRKEGR